MDSKDHIRNPIEWVMDEVKAVGGVIEKADHNLRHPDEAKQSELTIRRIEIVDLKDALVKGFADLGAYRTDIIFVCIIYPVAGLVLSRLLFGYDMLPLLFPLLSGFALIGPVAAVGLYEISRRRERGDKVTWLDAFGVIRAPAFTSIIALGLVLLGIFLVWLGAAYAVYAATLGPEPPVAIGAFIQDVFTTSAGWAMIIFGFGIGFLFALLVLTISVVSFPLLLDKNVGVNKAIETSVRAVRANPKTMAVWGMIVAGSLVLGSLPALLGLIIVMPLLGHATWHLYRKVVGH
ncbi:DUF2189 domain-containing protein [Limibacillus halophilus]|uniref:Putative membrane protein n=1 Tax=Limibacillus halophilus TaxID=1579333 RepID=A0A839SVW1_9PROT|nr:DUF2189 domain-containing protein [Limibacillus halophilus]MBB3066179.1 putative membrane protein [Limibacillus halophilus]